MLDPSFLPLPEQDIAPVKDGSRQWSELVAEGCGSCEVMQCEAF